MRTSNDIELRLRAARPRANPSPPPLTAVLARIEQVTAPSSSTAPVGWTGRGRRLRSRAAIPVTLAAIALAGAGGSALLLTQGKPLPPAYLLPARPNIGLGRAVPASLALLPMRAPDPEGGPPWGMRVIHTTRGLVCLQAGRVLDGKLGALGAGYAFHDDGRFHAFLPADAISLDSCQSVGTHESPFMPDSPVIVTANGLPLAGENVRPADRVHCDLPGQEDWGVRCPQSELRQVAIGLLGPDASSIHVKAAGQQLTVKPYGPEGAYLIVLRAQPNANLDMQSGSWDGHGNVSSEPGGAMLTVTYDNGSQCEIPPGGPSGQCHQQGLDSERRQLPTSAQLSTPVHAHYVPLDSHSQAPLLMDARGGDKSFPGRMQPDGREPAGAAVTASFIARVAAPSASSAYVLELRPQPHAGCPTPEVIVSQPTDRTIAAGTRLDITAPLETSCATSYAGRVFYARSFGGGDKGGEGPLYEVIAEQFGPPNSGRNPMSFPTVGRFRVSVP